MCEISGITGTQHTTIQRADTKPTNFETQNTSNQIIRIFTDGLRSFHFEFFLFFVPFFPINFITALHIIAQTEAHHIFILHSRHSSAVPPSLLLLLLEYSFHSFAMNLFLFCCCCRRHRQCCCYCCCLPTFFLFSRLFFCPAFAYFGWVHSVVAVFRSMVYGLWGAVSSFSPFSLEHGTHSVSFTAIHTAARHQAVVDTPVIHIHLDIYILLSIYSTVLVQIVCDYYSRVWL